MALANSIKVEAENNLASLSKMPGGKSKTGLSIKNTDAPAVFQGSLKIAEQAAEVEKLAEMLLKS
jgi:hypothetical protein